MIAVGADGMLGPANHDAVVAWVKALAAYDGMPSKTRVRGPAVTEPVSRSVAQFVRRKQNVERQTATDENGLAQPHPVVRLDAEEVPIG